MRYVSARHSMYEREQAYRFYIAENLRMINENLTNLMNKDGEMKYLTKTLQEFEDDIFHPHIEKSDEEIEENRQKILNKLR